MRVHLISASQCISTESVFKPHNSFITNTTCVHLIWSPSCRSETTLVKTNSYIGYTPGVEQQTLKMEEHLEDQRRIEWSVIESARQRMERQSPPHSPQRQNLHNSFLMTIRSLSSIVLGSILLLQMLPLQLNLNNNSSCLNIVGPTSPTTTAPPATAAASSGTFSTVRSDEHFAQF